VLLVLLSFVVLRICISLALLMSNHNKTENINGL